MARSHRSSYIKTHQGTAGIGAHTLTAPEAHKPGHLIFPGRSKTRATSVISSIQSASPNQRIAFLECDLASFDSVRAAAVRVRNMVERLDILILNAGIMAADAGLTSDGYEINLGTNHLGHALLVREVMPVLEQTTALPDADVRIVALSSIGFHHAPSGGIQFERLKTSQYFRLAGLWVRYGQSKLANIPFVRELAKRYPKITASAVHPGVVFTGMLEGQPIYNRALVYATCYPFLSISMEETIKTPLWAATTDKGDVESGCFYELIGKHRRQNRYSEDDALAEKLWEWTEQEIQTSNRAAHGFMSGQ
ncbi:MAG: hypothetical protein M1814_003577 [Vezdaea aestivalis]|nr:MAG: hypothetical protein M1814_003577 [Vezdaea aestivalis]